ncbi:hypothetical protein EUX98_g8175 [Antrodiella citrinella]|uniref:Uncharacterized protein n=1 Tax=Antrodiella citrinella TaxID=2447956 RepID=A0A4S4MB07_9APHY|nr:hypothetical protein EUX98_g8175 [Antrodiella citrinella]
MPCSMNANTSPYLDDVWCNAGRPAAAAFPSLDDVWWTAKRATVVTPTSSTLITTKSCCPKYALSKSTSSYLDDVWWDASLASPASFSSPTTPAPLPSNPEPVLPPILPPVFADYLIRTKGKSLSWKKRIFGSKLKHHICPKVQVITAYGATHYQLNLISLDDARSRTALRLHTIQHLMPDVITMRPGLGPLPLLS